MEWDIDAVKAALLNQKVKLTHISFKQMNEGHGIMINELAFTLNRAFIIKIEFVLSSSTPSYLPRYAMTCRGINGYNYKKVTIMIHEDEYKAIIKKVNDIKKKLEVSRVVQRGLDTAAGRGYSDSSENYIAQEIAYAAGLHKGPSRGTSYLRGGHRGYRRSYRRQRRQRRSYR